MTRALVRHPLLVPWLLVAAFCAVLMALTPGEETVPYHLAWAAFALAYGFDPWPLRRTAGALALFTVVTGGIMVSHAVAGAIAWEEITEVPLMGLLAVLMVWHVRRRQAALAAVTALAAREREQARQRERLARVTSHEMRTPLTIANGYVDLLLAAEEDAARRSDLLVVRDELGRLERTGDRLLRLIRIQDTAGQRLVDVDALLAQTADRWSAVADRRWVVDSDAGGYACAAERLRACLDTMIENAVRYTGVGGTVRLTAHRRGEHLLIGVADSGPGLPADLVAVVNAGGVRTAGVLSEGSPRDTLSQTGLGLGLVHEVVGGRGGRMAAGVSAEGGALVLMVLPTAGSVPLATVTPVRLTQETGTARGVPA